MNTCKFLNLFRKQRERARERKENLLFVEIFKTIKQQVKAR